MNDSRLKRARKTPPTKLAPLAEYQYDLYLRDEPFVYINDHEEYYVGLLIGYSFARGDQPGGYILDMGEEIVEWSALGGKSLYRQRDRYKELLEYFNDGEMG